MPRDTPSLGEEFAGLPPELMTADVEQALLGSLLIRNGIYDQVSLALDARDFSYAVHGRMFGLIGQLLSDGKPADTVTINRLMADDETYKQAGGPRYMAALVEYAFPPNALSYAEQIADAAARRSLIAMLRETAADAVSPGELRGFADVVDVHERNLALLRDGTAEERAVTTMAEAVDAALRAAEAVWQADGKVIGTTTGLSDLDRALGGLHRTDLVIIAGRPGMGKSALATTVAEAAASTGKRIFFASLEMSADQIAARQIAAATGISAERQRNGPLMRDDISALIEAGNRIRSLPIFFDDMMLTSIEKLRAKLKRHRRRRGLDLVVVDYLQLMQGTERVENRVQEVSAITRGLKAIAKDFEVPVVALSQLSRAVEQRDDKRPHLADLRDSGSIEQDADVVMFLYRDEYYALQEEPQRRERETNEVYANRVLAWDERCRKVRNISEIIISKNRHGSTKTVAVRFDAERTAFQNLTRQATP